MTFIGSLDQGTTSTRFIIVNHEGEIIAQNQLEHQQILPHSGWVEHDADEIWRNTLQVITGAISDANISPSQLAAIGITNQRETTVCWSKSTGEALANAIVWQDTRTADFLNNLSDAQKAALSQQITEMAAEQQQVINNDHVLVQEFWEAFDYLDNGDMSVLNHSRDPGLIAVNLNHFLQVATERRQQVPPLRDLKKVLKTSSRRKFVDVKVVNSGIRSGQSSLAAPSTAVKCWVFQREK